MTRFLNSVDISTRADTEAQGALIGTVTTMPAASIYNVGCTVFYAGTTGTYDSGCLYTCVQSGASYKWEKTAILAQGLELGTTDRAVITDASGKVIAAGVTSAELGYLSGVTSGLQAQLDGKVPTSRTINGKALTSDITLSATDIGAAPSSGTLAASRALQTSTNGEVEVSNVTVVELSYLSGVTSAIQDQIDGKADHSDIPTLISQLTNDSGFITNAVSDLVNYYTKDETYTRTEISNMISAIPKFSIQVVQSLPSSGISTTTIYLTPSGGGSGNSYSEYIYVNSQWELIGSTAVDLSDYYTKAQVNAMVTPVQSTTGITINGVGLQEATSGQPGLMTVAQVGQLATAVSNAQSALNGNVTGGTLSTDTSGNLSLTLNRTAGALSIGPTAITAARAVADGSGNNIASTYLTSSSAASTYATQSALSSGLAGKADAGTEITGGAFSTTALTLNRSSGNLTINTPTLTANRAVVTNSSGKLAASTVTATELGYLDGVTSRIQTQLNNITGDISDIQSTLEGLSGGGGKYITSGFSNYVGHSAIGFSYRTQVVGGNFDDRQIYEFAIGIIDTSGNIEGYGWYRDSTLGGGWDTVTSISPDYAIVF